VFQSANLGFSGNHANHYTTEKTQSVNTYSLNLIPFAVSNTCVKYVPNTILSTTCFWFQIFQVSKYSFVVTHPAGSSLPSARRRRQAPLAGAARDAAVLRAGVATGLSGSRSQHWLGRGVTCSHPWLTCSRRTCNRHYRHDSNRSCAYTYTADTAQRLQLERRNWIGCL
jgi:hypothetical protein